MATDTSKITGAADDLSDKLTKGGGAAKTLGAEIANAIKSLDGRVSAIEAGGGTQPPVEPPIEPPATNKGVVTQFSPNNGAYFYIDAFRVQVENANKNYNITNPDQYTLRFEIHRGDTWQGNTTADRSEIDGWPTKYSEGQQTTAEFSLKIEPPSPNSSSWMNFSQTHHDTPEPGHVPMWFGWYGTDKFEIGGCHSNGDIPKWRDTVSTERGRWYQFKITVMTGSNGKLLAWKDGVQVMNYNGPLGRGPGSKIYWKWGLYRGDNCNDVISAVYKNIYVY